MLALTVLYDPECGLCRRAHEWLAEQSKLVELKFVPCASDEARKRYPQLDHDLTKQDLTIITEDGWVFRSESMADGPVGTDSLSRLVLSTSRARVAAHNQTRGLADLAEPLPDQPRHRTNSMTANRKQKAVKTVKGDQTKALILETALEMFRERGYDETTMRAVAQKAGVSLGNAYYYFHSKEYLIQAFYQRLNDSHFAAALPALEHEKTLKARLLAMMRTKIETMEPYHQFAGVLFKTAANPRSPLNPFGDESDPVREASIQLCEKVLEGEKVRIPKDLRAELPYLLWVYSMGIVLFWIHDQSPKHRRTYRLIDHTVDLLDKLIHLASNPFMRPLRKQALRLVNEIKEVLPDDNESETT